MEQKSNIKKAIAIGLLAGFLASAGVISGITAKTAFNNYRLKRWAGKEGYVCMDSSRVTERTNPLYTDGLVACCGLFIDDKKSGRHYLAHFTSATSEEEILSSITNNFSNLSELEITLVAGEFANSDAAKKIYNSLAKLNAEEKARFVQNSKIWAKEGHIITPRY